MLLVKTLKVLLGSSSTWANHYMRGYAFYSEYSARVELIIHGHPENYIYPTL